MKIEKTNTAFESTINALYAQATEIIDNAREKAYRQVNEALVERNWELGRLIFEEELHGEDRAAYGAAIIKGLSKRLTAAYGKGFTKSYLYSFVIFYKNNPGKIFQTMFGKFSEFSEDIKISTPDCCFICKLFITLPYERRTPNTILQRLFPLVLSQLVRWSAEEIRLFTCYAQNTGKG